MANADLERADDARLNPFEIRATALAERQVQPKRSIGLNPFEIRATALARQIIRSESEQVVLIPLKSGQLLWLSGGATCNRATVLIPLKSGQLLWLGKVYRNLSSPEVLIPLKSGQLLWRRFSLPADRSTCVLIPLKSGQLLWPKLVAASRLVAGLNPFEIRATALAWLIETLGSDGSS